MNYEDKIEIAIEEDIDEELEDEIETEMEIELSVHARQLMESAKVVITLLGNMMTHHPTADNALMRRPKTRKGFRFIMDMMDGDPSQFRQLYRMYPDVFIKLCQIIREKAHVDDTRYTTVEEMLATFLIIVGHNDRYCNVRERFGRSHFATSQNFNKILRALNTIAPDMMFKPTGAIPAKIRESTRFYPYFKDCIGAIDGTHIPATIIGKDVSCYRNRHGVNSQNVLAACNFDLQFIYVLSGWEGSAHDSKILSDAYSRPNGLHVPQGKYFLVDCGFANRRQFLAPLRGVRYHLKDFGGDGRNPRNADELFNLRHASLRNVIERIFGIFKSRFTIFKTAPPFPFQTQAELVLACAGLHNFLRKECRSDEFPVEVEEGNVAADVENDADILDYLSQSQLSQRNEANTWRASIANAMWENRHITETDQDTQAETEDNS
ncbi:uncharacterized protein LOC131002766 isoform X1 [Salvia miltiorrhiza]|uniref:uncharacterized protein LOC131002766 isoform X1 n=1 Tax=Salvia miltiorrhiza TaxID=226208 RepID=UPI0025AB8289|nr:uncharacterized protein LOC131002766 isoform X1 [Salvia miltiorrhiza]XP_057785216.1 uncharacterized protein LOC131002766 isoform X1 [Salvia miltiorrhiza]